MRIICNLSSFTWSCQVACYFDNLTGVYIKLAHSLIEEMVRVLSILFSVQDGGIQNLILNENYSTILNFIYFSTAVICYMIVLWINFRPPEVEQSILEDLRNRVQLSSLALPSVSFYTFYNTHNGYWKVI